MLLTRRKIPSQQPKTLTNGIHLVRIESISEIGGNRCVWIFTSNNGQIRLELPINEYLNKLIGQIGFIGAIPARTEINITDLINLQIKITVHNGKIKSITKP